MLPTPSAHMREVLRRFVRSQRSARTAKTYGSIASAFAAFLGRTRSPLRGDVEQFLARPLRSGGRSSEATYNQALAAHLLDGEARRVVSLLEPLIPLELRPPRPPTAESSTGIATTALGTVGEAERMTMPPANDVLDVQENLDDSCRA
jgi:hypothetical protein